MSTALAWIWTKAELRPLWRKITLHRHKAELRALQAARSMRALAIFPIFFTVGTWFFLLAGVPSLVLFLLMHVLSGFALLLGTVAFALYSVFCFVALIFVAPWFFRWYFIAAAMMFGRTAMADRKEAELIALIAAAETPS